MSHKLAKLIKYNKHNYQASKSASSKYLGRRLGDRPLLPSSIANVTTGTFAGLMLCLAIPVFASSTTYAKPYSMTVTIDRDVVDLSVSPSEAGTFAKSSNSTVSVSTTNASGYTLSIASSGRNDGRLVNSSDEGNSNSDNSSSSSNSSSNDGTNGNNYLSSIKSATTEEQFRALDATSYNNMWGYLPSKWDGKDNTAFLPSPTTSGDVLDHTTTANPEANKYTLAIGARVDTTQKIGAYSNTYVVLATANGTPYTITYKDDTITNFPTDVSSTADSATVPIAAAPVKPGYTFLGWCTVAPTPNSNGNDSCTGTTYAANSTWELDQTSSTNNLVLYAMWGDNYTIDAFIAGGGTMQDLGNASLDKKSKLVASMPTETNYTLKDSRDQQEYTIAKLRDGNIWMTTNLNLAGGSEVEHTMSDVPAGYTLPVENGFQSGNKLPDSFDGVFSGIDVAHVYNSGNTVYVENKFFHSYYSWAAATAGSGIAVETLNTDAPYSICPKGWKLPTSRRDNTTTTEIDPSLTMYSDLYKLVFSYAAPNGTTTAGGIYHLINSSTVPNFLISGWVSGAHVNDDRGLYWSSTASSRPNAFFLSIDSSSLGVASAAIAQKNYGFSVRCLLK